MSCILSNSSFTLQISHCSSFSSVTGQSQLRVKTRKKHDFKAARTVIEARAKDPSSSSEINKQKSGFRTPFPVSARLVAQILLTVAALGFIDAGYSGDWSRIGVISQETEASLRLAAFGVVPFCIFLVWFISKGKPEEEP